MRRYFFVFLIFCFVFLSFGFSVEHYDIVIVGGKIYDGSGKDPFKANIGIKKGYIKTIGDFKYYKAKIIKAEGMYVCPGFIDIHTHCDRGIGKTKRSNAKNYLTQGVVTVVTGNCGVGTYRVAEYFSKLDSMGIGPNVVHLIGHGTVRKAIMGQAAREPTGKELEKMKKLIAKGMEDGAAGFSTGLFYTPGSYARTKEIIELARTVKKYNGIYASHIRDESNYSIGLKEAIREAIVIGQQAGIPVQISHIKALGKPVWGQSVDVCRIIEDAQERGLRIYADQYPYIASSTGLSAATIPRWVMAGGKMKKRLKNQKLLPKIIKEVAENISRRGGPESLVIVFYAPNRELNGKHLLEISKSINKPVVDTAIYLVLNGNPSVISYNMIESDVQYFMKKPYVMTSSDGYVLAEGSRFSHPRSFGAFTRKISKYVIEEKIITMEQAVRAASALPAEMLGLKNRGKLAEGFIADIVVFDAKKIRDLATFSEPGQYSTGIHCLFINGEVVIADGNYNGKLAGKTIRMNRNQ